MSEQVICVLGMHRSGTSFLTGSLQNAGINLGKHSAWNPHNLRGNRENSEIVAFHDSLLAANGGSWDHPPAEVRWQAEHFDAARALINAYREGCKHDGQAADKICWGFKDPRSLLVLDGWLELLPVLNLVGIFRHPAAVVRSIRKRGSGSLTPADIMQVWDNYNRRLIAYQRSHSFPLLCFDWDTVTLQNRLDAVLEQFGLTPVQSSNPFFAADLRSDPDDSSGIEIHELPPAIAATYAELQAIAN